LLSSGMSQMYSTFLGLKSTMASWSLLRNRHMSREETYFLPNHNAVSPTRAPSASLYFGLKRAHLLVQQVTK
jgi:hypothetical protein